MEIVKVSISSLAPMLMHSDATANPLGYYTKELKKITAKRKKTDEDHEAMSRIEFIASCYYNKRYFIPAANFEACFLNSAKQFKMGTLIKQALIIPDDGAFIFPDHDKEPERLYELKQYVDMRTVKVQMSKTIRTRPIFNEWETSFEAYLDTDKMDKEVFINIVENAGKYIGLGDYRPRYGRFEIKKVKS